VCVCANMCNIAYWNNAAYRYLREQAQSCRSSGVCLFRNTGACTWNDCVSACALKCLHSVHMSAFSSHVCMCAQTSAFRSHVCMCSQVSAFRSHVCIQFTCLHVCSNVCIPLTCLHVLSSVCIPFTCLHMLLHSVHMSACAQASAFRSHVCMCSQMSACVLKRLHSVHMSACALKCLHVCSSVCMCSQVSACVLKRLHSAHMSACALKCLHCDHMSACAPAFRSHVCMCSSVCIVCIVIIRLHAPLSRRKNVNSSSQGAGMIGLCHTRVRTEVCVHMDTCLCPCLITNQTYN